MKFSMITTFALFGSIIAAPTSDIEKRGVTDSVSNIVNTLTTSVNANILNINNLAASVKNSVGASAQVIVDARADLVAIKDALVLAATQLTGNSVGAVGGIAGAGVALTQEEIDRLTNAINQLQALISAISATATVTVTDLGPAAQILLAAQLAAVKAAIAPFAAPLTVFATAVSNAQANASLTVTGLRAAITGIRNIFLGYVGTTL